MKRVADSPKSYSPEEQLEFLRRGAVEIISEEDLLFAKEKGVTLEITSRKGHSLSNGYVAKEAMRFGVPLCMNTDSHSPSDLITKDFAMKILLAAGIEENRIASVFENSKAIVEKSHRRD